MIDYAILVSGLKNGLCSMVLADVACLPDIPPIERASYCVLALVELINALALISSAGGRYALG